MNDSNIRHNPWWHSMRPEDVLERASSLPISEQHALISEIKAACASMSLRVQDKSLAPDDRWQATRALQRTVQKKRLLTALANRSTAEGYDHKRERVETMIEAAETSEDPVEAVRLLAATLRAMWNME